MPDLSWREGLVMAPLLGLIVFLGVYPQPMLDRIQPSVDRLVTHIEDHSDYVEPEVAHQAGDEAAAEDEHRRRRAGRGGGHAMTLLAILSQPIEQDPVPDRRRRCRLVGARPDAHADRWRPAAPRRRLAVGPQARCESVYALCHHAHRRPARSPSPSRCGTACRTPDEGPFSTLGQAVGVDGFSVFATVTIAAAVILGALLMDGWLRREGMEGAEPYVLMLLSASGGVMMASANDLIVMFLGLEILSIAVYVLAAMHLRKITSQEAGVKYFVLGAFSSAFFLYGIALTYGGTGSTNLVDISQFLATTVLTDTGLRARRAGPAPRGLRLQGRRRAVPLLDARRVPGRAQPERRVDGLGREGRRLRRACSASSTWPSAPTGSTGSRSSSSLAALTMVVGLGAGHRADRREAHARLQLDQPRRVHPRGGPGGQRARACRRRSSTWRPTRSWWRAASASSPWSAARATSATASTTTAACPATARCWRSRSRCFLLRPGRRAAHLGLLRQVLRHHRGRRGGLHLAGDHRHAHRRHRRLPLPADHRVDVHVGRGRRRAPHHPVPVRRRPRPQRLRGRHPRRRPLPRPAGQRRQGRHPGPRPRAGRRPGARPRRPAPVP